MPTILEAAVVEAKVKFGASNELCRIINPRISLPAEGQYDAPSRALVLGEGGDLLHCGRTSSVVLGQPRPSSSSSSLPLLNTSEVLGQYFLLRSMLAALKFDTCHSKDMADDWRDVTDAEQRKMIQDKLAQRARSGCTFYCTEHPVPPVLKYR